MNRLSSLQRSLTPINLFTDQELVAEAGKYLAFDIECYSNYFLIAFKSMESEKVIYFEQSPDSTLDISKLMWVLRSFILVGFNSRNYDIPLAWLACTGVGTETLKACSDASIKEDLRPQDLEKRFGFRIFDLNHIDLIEVAPLKGSLKLYAGRLHATRLQDLPYSPNQALTREEALVVRHYCVNDLDCTRLLYQELCPQIRLREQLGEVYGQDLRSKSDAQIAETVIRSEVSKLVGHQLKRPQITPGTIYKYNMPDYIQYSSKVLQDVQERVRRADFVVKEDGKLKKPPELDKHEFVIGKKTYTMGLGGLHSKDKNMCHKADKDTKLCDVDIASNYPIIILNQKLYPKHMGEYFLTAYRTIVERRLTAKKNGDKVVANSLKIVINGSFGKFGSKYSILYSPDLMMQVTITGQLALLMLIERIELAGIEIASANTDGIVIKCLLSKYEELRAIITLWEKDTVFETEETNYKAIYCRDVNNYYAVKEDNSCKVKGCYAERGSALNSILSKNPVNLICSDAVQAMLLNNIPIEQTIKNCKDVKRFLTLRKVEGGAKKGNTYLGKIVRWYYAKGEIGTINYIISGNTVARSEGAKPLMDLSKEIPSDLNYRWYINEANSILTEIAFYNTPKKAKQLKFF